METYSEYHFLKYAFAGILTFIAASCSACGASLSRDTVIGTTSYLQVHNERYLSHGGTTEEHTDEERAKLSALIQRRAY